MKEQKFNWLIEPNYGCRLRQAGKMLVEKWVAARFDLNNLPNITQEVSFLYHVIPSDALRAAFPQEY